MTVQEFVTNNLGRTFQSHDYTQYKLIGMLTDGGPTGRYRIVLAKREAGQNHPTWGDFKSLVGNPEPFAKDAFEDQTRISFSLVDLGDLEADLRKLLTKEEKVDLAKTVTLPLEEKEVVLADQGLDFVTAKFDEEGDLLIKSWSFDSWSNQWESDYEHVLTKVAFPVLRDLLIDHLK